MELLKRFKQGDTEAFETLFRQFQAEVYGWIVQIVRDPGIAEDLTIETFWRIHKARARFDTEASFGAWARRIARNLAIDHVRSRRRTQEFSEQSVLVEAPDATQRRETHEKIERAFRRLPSKRVNVPIPIERVIVFPMALIPNLWGFWNMLYVWLRQHRKHFRIIAWTGLS
jgi:RNA polymerase sigma-70 factor (ECF subfamily)